MMVERFSPTRGIPNPRPEPRVEHSMARAKPLPLKTALHWFRRDLRVTDNTALWQAYSESERLVPVFCWDDAILRSPDVGPARVDFLLRSLQSLSRNLESLGHRLIIRRGRPEEVLPVLAREAGAAAVFVNRDYEPYSVARDARVEAALTGQGIALRSHKDMVLHEGREVLTRTGTVFSVFTPYSKAWKARPVSWPEPRLGPPKAPVAELVSLPLPEASEALGHRMVQSPCPSGERAGLESLDRFLQDRVSEYDHGRNVLSEPSGTSGLSPHLRFGTVGIRTVLERLQSARARASTAAAQKSCDTWLSELIWREFYIQILANHPRVASGAFRSEYDQIQWEGTDAQFDAWCHGQTGYPIVDAAMRCLNATGWMHNRLRMIVAMFLTKDLMVSWQRGERYFMRTLVDGDLAANNGGWQWSAGCGTDAAPYFRIFNPVTQGLKCDPEGAFVRRWVPELRDAPSDCIHEPWTRPLLLSRYGYAPPIVQHDVQRGRCLAMFKAVKGAASQPIPAQETSE